MSITPPRDEASVAVRQRLYVDAKHAAVWGLGVNFLLVISKLAGGIVTGSAALIADAVNSNGDVASSMAVRGALSMAQVEEDDDHPYGHTKAESIAGLSVSLLVAFSAGLLALETIKRFGGELAVPSLAAGIAKADPSPQIRISQQTASATPPPTQKPSICAIVGLGNASTMS